VKLDSITFTRGYTLMNYYIIVYNHEVAKPIKPKGNVRDSSPVKSDNPTPSPYAKDKHNLYYSYKRDS